MEVRLAKTAGFCYGVRRAVEAAKAAATDNPKLKAAPVATSSSVDHAGGTGEGAKKPTSIEGAATAHYAGRSA